MRRVLNLILALYITGCGAQEAADPQAQPLPLSGAVAAQPVASETAPKAQADVQKDAPETLTPDEPALGSFLVATVPDLPSCDAKHNTALAYVKAEANFYVCDGATWGVIEIDGKDGSDGATGKDGQSIQGPRGERGSDGLTVTGNMWLDPVEGIYWLIGAPSASYNVAKESCTRGWRLPIYNEITVAQGRGLSTTSDVEAWTSDVGKSWNTFDQVYRTPPKSRVYCVQNSPEL